MIKLLADVEVLWGFELEGTVFPDWESVRDQLPKPNTPEMLDATQFMFDSPYIQRCEAARAYASSSFPPGRSLFDAVLDLTSRIHAEFSYDPQATNVSTTTKELLQLKRGVCQDFAHLQITCLRSLGLAARYVSGYLVTHPPEGKPRLVGADASHAWVSVYCGTVAREAGPWIDLDPTNNVVVGDGHVTLAWGRDFSDVTPMRGVILGGGEQDLAVRVTVTPQS